MDWLSYQQFHPFIIEAVVLGFMIKCVLNDLLLASYWTRLIASVLFNFPLIWTSIMIRLEVLKLISICIDPSKFVLDRWNCKIRKNIDIEYE